MGLTAVADRTNNYNGCEIYWSGKDGVWKEEWLGDEPPEAAKCIVYHKHREHPEIGIARWAAYVGQMWNQDKRQWEVTDFWSRMPDYMLAKCAKAQALRGAFPDPLSNVYIHEELESSITDAETATETIPKDEAKIAENQRRDEELKKSGTKFVDMKGTRPTPEQALEPAFDEDKIPAPALKPEPPSRPKQQQPPTPTQTAPEPETTPPDDLDMGPAPPTVEASEVATPEQAPPPAVEPPWKSHVILGITHVKFHKKRIDELAPADLATIETQWLPAVRQQWDNATDAQRADAAAFEAAIAYQKMVKPW
jgi:hypothetical protein